MLKKKIESLTKNNYGTKIFYLIGIFIKVVDKDFTFCNKKNTVNKLIIKQNTFIKFCFFTFSKKVTAANFNIVRIWQGVGVQESLWINENSKKKDNKSVLYI